jgi:hypothetical protein
MSHGPYDKAAQFLLDTMHNPNVSFRNRIEAAKTLLEHHSGTKWEDLDPMDRVTIVVRGFDPTAPMEPVRQYTGQRPNDLVYRILDPHPHQKRWVN